MSARAISLWTDTGDEPGISLLNSNSTVGLDDCLISNVTWHISGLVELFFYRDMTFSGLMGHYLLSSLEMEVLLCS